MSATAARRFASYVEKAFVNRVNRRYFILWLRFDYSPWLVHTRPAGTQACKKSRTPRPDQQPVPNFRELVSGMTLQSSLAT